MVRLLRLLLHVLLVLVVVLQYNFIHPFQILLRFQLINMKTTKIQTKYNNFNHHHHLYTSKGFVSSSSVSSLFLYRNINNDHNDTQLQQQLPITTTSTTTQKTSITAANASITTMHDVVVNRTKEWSNHNMDDTTTMDTSIVQSQDMPDTVDVVSKENSKNNTTISNYIIPSTSSLPLSVTSSLGDIMSMTYIQSSSLQIPLSTVTKETTPTSFITQSIEPKNESSYTSLQEMYNISHPLDRMILTANGNVQRLISSYYDTNVYVNILYCNMREQSQPHQHPHPTVTTTTPQIWDRKVQLYIQPTKKRIDNTITNNISNSQNHTSSSIIVLCEATSIITIYDIQIQQLIMSNQIGIGQIFRYYNILPNFTLHTAGPINTTTTTTTVQTNNNGGGNFWREYTLSSTQLSCFIREEFINGLWDVI